MVTNKRSRSCVVFRQAEHRQAETGEDLVCLQRLRKDLRGWLTNGRWEPQGNNRCPSACKRSETEAVPQIQVKTSQDKSRQVSLRRQNSSPGLHRLVSTSFILGHVQAQQSCVGLQRRRQGLPQRPGDALKAPDQEMTIIKSLSISFDVV